MRPAARLALLAGWVVACSTVATRPPHEALEAVAVVCGDGACGEVAIFEDVEELNASVTFDRHSVSIYYNPWFISLLSEAYGSAAVFAIFAHEAAHAGDAAWSARTPHGRELYADEMAGCALARTGRPLEPWLRALVYLSPSATDVHPAAAERILAAWGGWARCAPAP